MTKLDLSVLKEQLKLLEKRLRKLGSPNTNIRRCADTLVSVQWLEKHDK